MNNHHKLEKQFDIEKKYAALILNSKTGKVRRKLYEKAYEELKQVKENGEDSDVSTLLINYICVLFPVPNNICILEVGCGTGKLCVALAKKGFMVMGLDLALDRVNLAKSRAKKEKTSCQFLHANFFEYRGRNKYQLIINDNVIEHIHPDELDVFIQKTYKLLDNYGFLLTYTPNALTGPHDVSKYFLPQGAKSQGLHLKEYTFFQLVQSLHSYYDIILTWPFGPRISLTFKQYSAKKIWYYKTLVMEQFVSFLPAMIRCNGFVNTLISNFILCQKIP